MDSIINYLVPIFNVEGHDLYFVGGGVRDALMGRTPHDYDFTTDATPEEMKRIAIKYNIEIIETGEKFGTMTFRVGAKNFKPLKIKKNYEITTYRIDKYNKDGERHPVVKFAKTLKEDLMRRDFTINALASNQEGTIIDYSDGQKDIEKGVIRCVGNPRHRFMEDPLRIYRMARFALRFGFVIDRKTLKASKNKKVLKVLRKVSKERKLVEMREILRYAYDDRFEHIYKDFIGHECQRRWEDNLPFVVVIVKMISRFRTVGCLVDPGYLLLTSHECKLCNKIDKWRALYTKNELSLDIYQIMLNKDTTDEEFDLINTYLFRSEKRKFKRFPINKTSHLKINGDEIMELGLAGKNVGKVLNTCLDQVMSEKIENEKESLIKFVKDLIQVKFLLKSS